MTLPFLSESEIADICLPLQQPAAQLRYLKKLGLVVNRKPNGRPLVARGEFERVLVGRQPEAQNQMQSGQPNRAGLLRLIGERRGKKT